MILADWIQVMRELIKFEFEHELEYACLAYYLM